MRTCAVCQREILDDSFASMHAACAARAETAGSLPSLACDPSHPDACNCADVEGPHLHMREGAPGSSERLGAALRSVMGVAVEDFRPVPGTDEHEGRIRIGAAASPAGGGGSVEHDWKLTSISAYSPGGYRCARCGAESKTGDGRAFERCPKAEVPAALDLDAILEANADSGAGHEDVRDLVAEVRRLRTELHETRVNYAADGARYIGLAAEVDRLRGLRDKIEPLLQQLTAQNKACVDEIVRLRGLALGAIEALEIEAVVKRG